MARFVHIEYSTEHGGVNRMARGFAALGSFSITVAALNGSAAPGRRCEAPDVPQPAA